MEFSAIDHREEGETLLRKCQLAELYLFDVFLEICKKYNLQYFVYGGTLLGAARHGGFIPWDDDIDVAMPLKDYRRFLKLAPWILPENLILVPGKEYEGEETFAKLRDRGSFFCEVGTFVGRPCGCFIDIFPYEKVPRLPIGASWFFAKWCNLSWSSEKAHRTMFHQTVLSVFDSAIKAFLWAVIFNVLKYGHRICAHLLPSVWRCSPGVPLYRPHIGFADDILFPLKQIVFEGRTCNCPRNVDAFLTQYYGDWRTLPPPEKRKWHASIVCPTRAPDAPWARPYKDCL